MADLLSAPRACACDGAGTDACGLRETARLSDAPPNVGRSLNHRVVAPVLLLSPLLQMAKPAQSWRLCWEGGHADCTPEGLGLSGDPPPLVSAWVTIEATTTAGDVCRPSWLSQPVEPAAWQTLEAYAARTYVPDSDHSTSAGAGPDQSEAD